MNTNQNKLKIISNSELVLYEKVSLDLLLENYKEIEELLELLCMNESQERILYLQKKFSNIKNKYIKAIKEKKRLLINTQKRLKYNITKCIE